jgi:hypothetical protein
MATTSRQVVVGNTIVLEIDVRDAMGRRADADSLPEVAIIDPNDNIVRAKSTTNVTRIEEGRYRLAYLVPGAGHLGIWIDHWYATLNGFPTEARLNFIVVTQAAEIDVLGDQIGDDARVTYTDEEIIGINKLLAMLKARLKNNVYVESIDAYGATQFVECPIFTNEELTWFLNCSLSEFNQTPHFTDFLFSDNVICGAENTVGRFSHILIEGAAILAVAAQMLIEAGKEFTIQDNGVSMSPPPLAATLNNQLTNFVSAHLEKLKAIKCSIKPHPLGIGSYRVLAISPNYLRLRHLRERRII